MTPQEILRQQRDLSPKDDLAQFAGEWVVLREGHVIAHGTDPVSLREQAGVEPEDPVMLVTSAPDAVLL